MTRVLAMFLLAAGLAIGLPTAAVADGCVHGGGGGTFHENCLEEGREYGEGTDLASMGPVFALVITEVEGVECWMIAVGGNMTWDEATHRLDMYDEGGDPRWDACEFEPVDLTPDLWTRRLCPPPAPAPLVVSPDSRAISGLRAFLEIRGPQQVDVPCGTGVISATARYVVHWGDGTGPVETTSRGGPHPGGDLTHVYQSMGAPTITVEAYWTGTIDGTTLPELRVPTTSPLTVDVDEVQAVING